jgi:hypothetical protein
MKNLQHAVAILSLLAFAACSHGPPKPKYVEEKNQAKFGTEKDLHAKPDSVMLAARAVLDRLTQDSEPAASDSVKSEDNEIYTGWVYSPASKDKYVDFDYNGTVQHKTLAMRRIYGFEVSPSMAGSHVKMSVEEEIQTIDMKTGEPNGWKRVEPEHAAYDMMYRKLQEAVSQE